MSIIIDNRKIGEDYPPYIIAELSANHNGSLEKAINIIDRAHSCGAHAVKIQTYTADTMTLPIKTKDFFIKDGPWKGYYLYDLYKWAETPFEWTEILIKYAQSKGITIFSSPFDETAVDLLEELNVPAYKIASFEMTDLPLVKLVASTGKPLIISTGMASELEIEETLNIAQENGASNIILLHCISGYPTPLSQANLSHIKFLKQRFKIQVGLSDHTLGNQAALAATALGATVIEKHFTLSRDDKGPDSEFSMEPDELTALCTESNSIWEALGTSKFTRSNVEEQNKLFRRSLYFSADALAGTKIDDNIIRRIRPGYGLAPKYYDQIIGATLKKNVTAGMAVSWDCIEK